ncbi:MAG: DNA-directed DNA polymerase [Candelina submexicana]|nr:MAG: DNA-directed DNA polymerase [Candelina submexicana]
MAKKRPREARGIDVELVEIYEDLANENETIRLKAAHALLTKLSLEQAPTTQDIEKALNRLIKGLSSGRKSARIGFSIALTELLTQLFGPDTQFTSGLHLNIEGVLEILQKQTHPVGSLPGQEQRDLYFGRLFGLEAVIKSDILFAPTRSFTLWDQVLDLIFELAKKKPWICEECGWILYEAIPRLSTNPITQYYTQAVVDKLHAHGLTKTPEGVAIWLSVRSLAPAVSLPKDVWHLDDPMDSKEKKTLAKVLIGHGNLKGQDDENFTQKGIWNSRLHFIWGVLRAAFAEVEDPYKKLLAKSKRMTQTTWARFWTEAVDNTLFSASASNERKFLGFQIFSKVLQEAPFFQLSMIFTKNLKKCLVNQLASSDRYLHKAALDTLRTMHARVDQPGQLWPESWPDKFRAGLSDPDLAARFLYDLQHVDGGLLFDQVTKTKTIEKLLRQARDESLYQIVKVHELMITLPKSEEDKSAEVQRRIVADRLVTILRTRKVRTSHDTKPEQDAWVREILYTFIGFAYFTPADSLRELRKPKPALSSTSRSMFRSRITSCLAHLLSIKTHVQADYAYHAICNIRHRQETETESESLMEADDNVQRSIQQAWKILDQIDKAERSIKEVDNQAHLRAMKLLYSLTILEVYNGTADAVSLLDELRICYDELIKPSRASNINSEASELLVEVLLSFVSKPSVLFRKLAQQVFTAFVTEINSAGLQSMLNVVLSKESTDGQQQMFDQELDEDGEVVNGNHARSDTEDDLSDVEVVDGVDVSSAGGTSDEESDGASSELSKANEAGSDTKENDEGNDELAAFDAKLAQALGTQGAGKDMAGASDQSSDSDMDDEQMMAIEPQLTQVFKERKLMTSKKEKKGAKETVVNFKLRVLDLLSIYTKKKHQDPTALKIIKPLLEAIRSTKSSQVSRKACQILSEYSKACKGKEIPRTDDNRSMWALLKDVYMQALTEGSNDYASACSSSSILLCKILVRADKTNFTGVGALYIETLSQPILQGNGKIRPSLLTDWNNWYSSLTSSLSNR